MADIKTLPSGTYVNIRLITERLGGNFNNCRKKGIVDFDIAVAIDPNIVATHANIYADLPPGTPRAAQELEYVALVLPDGKTSRALALPWIDNDVTVVTEVIATTKIVLSNSSELERLNKYLLSGGFKILSMEIPKNV
ncbi:MAG: phage DNA polymerase-associated SH3 family protein [Clostridium sp.]|uniref:phage DNA polymerase-associated SH3 family protein n=1 Tax=Clostridium sp. TaxID=1506 RepID=UPI003EE77676